MLTVTSAADDRALLTLGELREACAAGASIPDSRLLEHGERIAATIARICKVAPAGSVPVTMRSETLSETFRLSQARRFLPLARRPIGAILTVTEADTALASTDFEIDASSGLLGRLSSDDPSTWACGKIIVTYEAGWQVVPADLKLAAAKLAQMVWAEQSREPGLKRENIPNVIEREYWVPPSSDPLASTEVMELLAPYINDWMG